MTAEQAFVSGVAFVLGGILIFVAIYNLEAGFQLPKIKWMESRFGRRGSRVCCALLGIGLIILGLLIAMGVGRDGNRSENHSNSAVFAADLEIAPSFFAT